MIKMNHFKYISFNFVNQSGAVIFETSERSFIFDGGWDLETKIHRSFLNFF
jgi:hypothetical protein